MRERSAVNADDQAVILGQCRHGRFVGAIAFVDPVGDIKRRLAAHVAEPKMQKRPRGGAIDIIVRENGNTLACRHGLQDAFGGLAHVAQRLRIRQEIAQGRVEKTFRLVRRNAAMGQHPSYRQRQARRLDKRLGCADFGSGWAAPRAARDRT